MQSSFTGILSILAVGYLFLCGYRISDASGELEITEVGKYPLKVEMLDSKVNVVVW